MKKVYLFISFLLLFLASCSNDSPPSNDPTKSSELNLLANIETRALVPGTTFVQGNTIAVYVAGSGYEPTQITPYTLTATDWTSGTPKINLTGNPATVYGYYPSDATITGATAPTQTSTIDATIFTLGKETSFDGSGQTDYLYATPNKTATNLTPGTSNAITLNFKHALTKICFVMNKDVNYPKSQPNGNITSIKLSGTGNVLPTAGTIKIADGTFTPNAAKNSASIEFLPSKLTYANEYNATPSTTITATGLVAPAISPLTSISLEATVDTKTMAIKGFPASIKWDPGTTYTYTITVSPTELIITSVSITDWTVGANTGGLTGS